MSQRAEMPTSSELLWQLRHLLVFTSVEAAAGAMMGPASYYAGLNYFASKHTSIPWREVACDRDVTPLHCQIALRDQSFAFTVAMLITPLAQIIIAPALGAYADSVGRRPALVLAQVTTLLQAFAATSVSCFGTSYWYAVALFPVAESGVLVGLVINTICLDLCAEREMRALGLGLLSAVNSASAVVALAASCVLTLSQNLALGLALLLAMTLYIFVMPETLDPAVREEQAGKGAAVPIASLSVLWRTPMLRRLSLLLVATNFTDAGVGKVMGYVLAGRMNWTAHDSQLSRLAGTVSTVIWTGIAFRPLLLLLGEAHVFILGRLALLADNIFAFSASRPYQVVLPHMVLSGPTHFTSVVIGAIKSKLVSEREQATVQAALNVALAVSTAAGSIGMSAIYQSMNRHYEGAPAPPPYRAVFLPISVTLACAVLGLSCLLPGQLRQFGEGQAEGDGLAAAVLPGPHGGPEVRCKTGDDFGASYGTAAGKRS